MPANDDDPGLGPSGDHFHDRRRFLASLSLWSLDWYGRLTRVIEADSPEIRELARAQRGLRTNGPVWRRPASLFGISGKRGLHLQRTLGPSPHADGAIVTMGGEFLSSSSRRRILAEAGDALGMHQQDWLRIMPRLEEFVQQFYRGPYVEAPAYLNLLSSRKRFRKRIEISSQAMSGDAEYLTLKHQVEWAGGLRVAAKGLMKHGWGAHATQRGSELRLVKSRTTRRFTTPVVIGGVRTAWEDQDIAHETHWCVARRGDDETRAGILATEWPDAIGNYCDDYYMTPLLGFARVLRNGDRHTVTRFTFEFQNASADISQLHCAEYDLGTALRISWHEEEHLRKALAAIGR